MRALHFLIKPASSLCNPLCHDCFYRNGVENHSWPGMDLMTRQTVELLSGEAFFNQPHDGTDVPSCGFSFLTIQIVIDIF